MKRPQAGTCREGQGFERENQLIQNLKIISGKFGYGGTYFTPSIIV